MKINKVNAVAAFVIGGLLVCSSAGWAQDNKEKSGKRAMPSVQERLDRMTEELKLTDDQKPKVKAVLEETDKKRQEVPREERRDKMPAIMEEQNKKLKEILTADQFTKWEKLRESMRPGRPGGPGSEKPEKKESTKES